MPASSPPVSSLRAHLLKSLQTLPGSRIFHIHVLVTAPRKPGQSLFLHAPTRPRCLVQDILVLLSEQTARQDTCDNLTPRTFVSAIEASVYAFPASESTILYISKVDGTGQGVYPSPTSTLLRAFLAFYASPESPLRTSHNIIHHLWIHLFARSQRQYLFPNSADHPDKKPLSDVGLCKWWKKVLSEVTKDVEAKSDVGATSGPSVIASETPAQSIHLYYILPGQSELEALHMLREAQPSSVAPRTQWIYSHPYNLQAEMGIPFPSSPSSSESQKLPPLASLIPHFEDDPKSRFLDELAATSEEQAVAVPVPTPRRKRAKLGEGNEDSNSTLGFQGRNAGVEKHRGIADEEPEVDGDGPPFDQPLPAIMYNPPSSSPPLAGAHSPPLRPSTPEPRESQGAALLSPHTPSLPTLPISLLSPHTPAPTYRTSSAHLTPQTPTLNASPRTPRTPRTPRRPKSDLDDVSPGEFWERMSFRQECAQGAVTGFFVAIFSHRPPHPASPDPLLPSNSSQEANINTTNDIPSALLTTGTIPHSVLKRVMSSLLTGVEFSTAERAHKGTDVMEAAIKGLCEGLGQGDKSNGEPAAKPQPHEAAAPLDPSLDIYASHVYACLSISNPALVRRPMDGAGGAAPGVAAPVNVLGVRRKKKRE